MKREQPFRVRLRFAHAPAQLREPGADQGHRDLPLRGAVQSGDERGELVGGHVMQLVDEQRHAGRIVPGGGANGLEQLRQVGFEVAVVGQTGFGFKVQADLQVLVLHLQR